MSRIGKLPVILPSGVQLTLAGRTVTVTGPKGNLEMEHHENVAVSIEGNTVTIQRKDEEILSRSLHGLTRTLIANMVEGVTKGYSKRLEIQGVGYGATATGTKIQLALGFSHPVEMMAPTGITVEMDKDQKNDIIITGIDKQKVGQFAAQIRELRPPEPYKGKGIRYKGEYVRKKAGKTAKKA